jgi:hypothetical protein
MDYCTEILDITAEQLSERNLERVSVHTDHYPPKAKTNT